MPGFKKDEIYVRVSDVGSDKISYLTIGGNRISQVDDYNEQYHRKERNLSSVKRIMAIPSHIDTTNITSSYDNGVLQVNFPKGENDHKDRTILVS